MSIIDAFFSGDDSKKKQDRDQKDQPREHHHRAEPGGIAPRADDAAPFLPNFCHCCNRLILIKSSSDQFCKLCFARLEAVRANVHSGSYGDWPLFIDAYGEPLDHILMMTKAVYQETNKRGL